jgi:CelD/BcsL family acetyltransferase involved in cellulose biosynthesis
VTCEQQSAPTIFHSPAYLGTYRRIFGGGRTFLKLSDESSRAYLQIRGKSARRLEWWGAGIHDIGGAVYRSEAGAEQLWARISDTAKRCDGAHLAQIRADDALVSLARRDGWTVEEAEACPVLALPSTWDAYVASLGKNMREQIKRYPKRLEKEFRVEYELAQTHDEVSRALDDLFVCMASVGGRAGRPACWPHRAVRTFSACCAKNCAAATSCVCGACAWTSAPRACCFPTFMVAATRFSSAASSRS